MFAERLRLLLPKVLHTDLPHRRGVAPGQLCGTELGPETPGPGLLKVPERPVKSITDALLDTYRYILAYPIRYKFIFIFISIDTLYIFSRARGPERAHSNVFFTLIWHVCFIRLLYRIRFLWQGHSSDKSNDTNRLPPHIACQHHSAWAAKTKYTHTQEKPSQGHWPGIVPLGLVILFLLHVLAVFFVLVIDSFLVMG